MFKRRGPVDACLIDILDNLSLGGTSSKYYPLISYCSGPGCKLKCLTPAGAPYMRTPGIWASATLSKDLPHRDHESLQEWVVGWFD
jgi:hypothetical protein